MRFPTLLATVLLSACALPHETTSPPTHRTCPAPGVDPAVTWYVPLGSDAREAEAWCRTLGPVVIHAEPSPEYGPWRSGDSLAVGVWNVAGGSGDLTEFLRAELGLACESGRPTTPVPHFVLLLQEAIRRSPDIPISPPSSAIPPAIKEPNRPGDRPDVIEVAERCGLAVAYVPSTRNGVEERDGLREDKGNAVMSTLPLSDVIAIEVPMVAQRRVAVAATVHGPNGDSLRLVSTHFNNFPTPWRFVKSGGSTRVQQALTVVDALDRIEHQRADDLPADAVPIATILAGDFNTWSTRETVLQRLRDHFPDSPPFQGKPTRTGFATDHVLFRGSTVGRAPGHIVEGSYRRIDDTYYSDHHPLMSWFCWQLD